MTVHCQAIQDLDVDRRFRSICLAGQTVADEHVDENARTRTTLLHYERQSLNGGLERLERPWVLHWYEPGGFERLATEADCTSSTPDPSHQITRCSQ
jgi:hypothetical protein